MPKSFNFNAPPFDGLTGEQQQWVRDSVDIGYYAAGAVVLSADTEPSHLFVVIKGHVQQVEQDEVVCVYGPGACFDGRSLVSGRVTGIFTAAEEMLAYLLPKATVKRLIAANAGFGALLFSDMSQKLQALTDRRPQRELHGLMMARIAQAFVRPARVVGAETDAFSIAQLFENERLSNVLVKDSQGRLGIFTSTDIRKVVLSGTDAHHLPVGQLATWDLVEVAEEDAVFDALILMIRHGVHRVVVRRQGVVVGVLEQLDLLSFISNHSHLVWLQVQQATSVAELKGAGASIQRLIQLLSESEVKVSMIARLVQELNAKIFTRLWQLVAPPDLVENSCVMVMGSEGRGEQILKTDQDNGLIIRDNFEISRLSQITAAFNDALYEIGYPPCLGGVMMRNPLWCQSLTEFKDTIRDWVLRPSMENHLRLAIFSDAEAVCGDRSLLVALKGYFFQLLRERSSFFPHFARAADQFGEQGGWWNRLLRGSEEEETVDVKKLGIFPIVHGVRSLALEAGIEANSTTDRMDQLALGNRLPVELVRDLKETLAFLMDLRLKQGLRLQALGQRANNLVELQRLSTLERDLLRDGLQVVKQFRNLLHHHFRLDAL
ncbi:MAG: CBS domain-containing protein [Betaproteobacteria bacterium]|nr:CBS domain-containing protein [Betaproteobacteria bacterium]MDE2623893.1 CBS domain-containing protein [Betaproteobacteria bacterium]